MQARIIQNIKEIYLILVVQRSIDQVNAMPATQGSKTNCIPSKNCTDSNIINVGKDANSRPAGVGMGGVFTPGAFHHKSTSEMCKITRTHLRF